MIYLHPDLSLFSRSRSNRIYNVSMHAITILRMIYQVTIDVCDTIGVIASAQDTLCSIFLNV